MIRRDDPLATPWSDTGVPVPHVPAVDGPPELARVDVTPRTDAPEQQSTEPASPTAR